MYCIVLLFLDVPKILGCSGGDYSSGPAVKATIDPFANMNLTGEKGDAVERNLAAGYGGFDPPLNMEKQWRYWLKQYELDMEEEEKGDYADGEKVDRGPGSGWPVRWMGLGSGHGGAPVPPWAYEPKDKDLPPFCYLYPEKGTCDKTLTRFGYNAMAQECQEFIYSGCGENQNNFEKKENCEVACMPMPISGCELDTQQYVESLD